MRTAGLIVAILLAGCSPAPQPRDPNSFEVDAKGAPAVVGERWVLRAPPGDSIGVVLSVARCGETLYAGDLNGRVLRLDLATGAALPPINEGAQPMSLVPDCDQGLLHAAGPAPSRREPATVVTTVDLKEGTVKRRLHLAGEFMPTMGGAVVDEGLMLSGLWGDPGGGGPPLGPFYADKRLGWIINDSGATTPAFLPFDPACRGAGACVGGTVAPLETADGLGWVVTQPAADTIAVFGQDRQLIREIGVTSPMFRNNAVDLAPRTLAEPRVRWMADNSLVNYSGQFGADLIGTVHSVVKLPPDWRFGQFVRLQVFLNLHSRDGSKRVADIGLPELPVGRDADGIYVVDYGDEGRQGSHNEVSILRIPVKSGTEGFRP